MYAARNTHPEVVGLLVDKGAHVDARNKKGRTALMEGIANSRSGRKFDVVKRLVDGGADVNVKAIDGTTALMLAAAQGCHLKPWYDRLKPLLPLLFGGPPLGPVYGGEVTDSHIVRLLLEHGADVNAINKKGWSALKRARARGDRTIEELLRAHGAGE